MRPDLFSIVFLWLQSDPSFPALVNSLTEVKVKVAQSCLTLCDPMGCSLPGSSVRGDAPGKNTGVGCRAVLIAFSPSPTCSLNISYVSWFHRHTVFFLAFAHPYIISALNTVFCMCLTLIHPLRHTQMSLL